MNKTDWIHVALTVAAMLIVIVVVGFLALVIGPLFSTGGLRAITPSRVRPQGHRTMPFALRGSRLGFTAILWPISAVLRLGVLVLPVLGGIWLFRHMTERRTPAPRCTGCGQQARGD